MGRGVCLLFCLVLAACWLVVGDVAHAQPIDDEARRIAQELQCPVCEGLSVADSPSQLASQMRGIIRTKLETGETRQQILGYFAERYGEGVLLSPPRTGFGILVWTAPYVALLGALGFVVWRVRSRRTTAALDTPTPNPSPPTPEIASYVAEVDQTFSVVRDEPLR